MARARLVNTGTATKRAQPKCSACRETIQPGERRWTWAFRYGGTYHRHEKCGQPRPSELTQGRVGELYAEQENVEDVVGKFDAATIEDFDSWKNDVAGQLEQAAGVADDLASDYEAAAEPFGGAGENQERAEQCQSWSERLNDAASEVRDIEVELDEWDGDPDSDKPSLEDAIETAREQVDTLANDACGELEL